MADRDLMNEMLAKVKSVRADFDYMVNSYEVGLANHMSQATKLAQSLQHSITILKRIAEKEEADLIQMLEDRLAEFCMYSEGEQERVAKVVALRKKLD